MMHMKIQDEEATLMDQPLHISEKSSGNINLSKKAKKIELLNNLRRSQAHQIKREKKRGN